MKLCSRLFSLEYNKLITIGVPENIEKMSCDVFTRADATALLANKRIVFCGSSNMRAIYKDLVWLLQEGDLVPQAALKRKNEPSHGGDDRLTCGPVRNSRNYEEVRRFKSNGLDVHFQFLTRLNLPALREHIRDMRERPPDVLVINSTLWDITRWGPDGVAQFKDNLSATLAQLRETVDPARTLVVWKTALSPSFACHGSLLTDEIQFMRSMLPFHMLEANRWAAEAVLKAGFDVLDLNYHMRFLLEFRCDDGIHFLPAAVRYMTNLLLTHVALSWGGRALIGRQLLNMDAVLHTGRFADNRGPVLGEQKAAKKEKLKRLQQQRNRAALTDIHNSQHRWPSGNNQFRAQNNHNRFQGNGRFRRM